MFYFLAIHIIGKSGYHDSCITANFHRHFIFTQIRKFAKELLEPEFAKIKCSRISKYCKVVSVCVY